MTLASIVQPRALGLARYRGEFPIFQSSVYLNTCSLGALGERSRRKVAEFLDLWQSRGAAAWYDVWWEALGDLRARYGRIVNAAAGEIALAPSIAVALSTVAESLDYNRRPDSGGREGRGCRRARRRRTQVAARRTWHRIPLHARSSGPSPRAGHFRMVRPTRAVRVRPARFDVSR